MPFTNPIIAGSNLVRPAIQSPDYTPGVSGWTINRDGTAEFSDTTVRGDMRIDDTDGSYLWLYDEDPGSGVVLELRPADDPTYGPVTTPARLLAGTDPALGSPGIILKGPSYSGAPQPYLFMGHDAGGFSNSTARLDGDDSIALVADTSISANAPTINLTGQVSATSLFEGGNPVVTAPSGFTGLMKWNDVTVTTNASGIGTITHGAGFTPSGVIICQAGVSGSSGVNVLVLNGSYTGSTFQFKATTSAGVYAGSIAISFLCMA